MTTVSAPQQEARQTIQEALGPFGYKAAYIRFGWQAPNTEEVRRYTEQEAKNPASRPSGTPRLLDALAFSDDRRQDWHTSAIAVDLSQDSAVGTDASERQARELFRLTAAPTNLVGSLARKKIDIWFNCHDGIVGPESVDLALDPLKAVFRRHRPSVQRDLLAHLREGQRHMFDGQVYARRDELASFLQRGVSKAAWVVGAGDAPWGGTKDEIATRREAFSRVALALLAARILEDKGALDRDRPQSTDSRRLLVDARVKWDSFFDTALTEDLVELDRWFDPAQVNLMLSCLLSHLTGPMNFALVTHEMIGDLYERALMAERSSQAQSLVDLKGVHYTPVAIAKRILDRIPLEDLPLEERTVCDLACGSGSFLLAATERLSELFHPREPGALQAGSQWVRQAVLGNDLDPVAILVAKLSYLVAYWNHVDDAAGVPFPTLHERGNALTLDTVAVFGRTPSVIVGNPPFDGTDPASAFLDRALTLLLNKESAFPRYLGMVMPGSFIKGKREQEAVRTRLLRHARILEMWELPEHAIGLCAETPTCVIIAEVTGEKPNGKQEVRVAQTLSRRDDAVSALRDSGVTTWSYVGGFRVDQHADDASIQEALAFSAIDDIWSELSTRGSEAGKLVQVVWGFVHTKSRGQPDPVFSPTPASGLVPYLRQQTSLRPYTLTEADWRASHDDDLMYWQRGTGYGACLGNWPNYESPKIIFTAQSNRNSSSQLVAALDFARYYPGKHFQVVTLVPEWEASFRQAYPTAMTGVSEEDALRWFCAILNSPVGHAWFVKQAGPRGPQADVCLTIPLPRDYDPAVAAAVAQLQRMPRPENIAKVATWNPDAGLVKLAGDFLFGAEATAVPQANNFWRAVGTLNNLVLDSYNIRGSSRDRMMSQLLGVVDPWVAHPRDVAQLTPTDKMRVLRGGTVSVDTGKQTVTVKLSWKALGNEEPVVIPAPAFMPGWALRPGREFTCRAPAKCTLTDLRNNPWLLREFKAVPYDYLPTETLEQMIGYRAGVAKP